MLLALGPLQLDTAVRTAVVGLTDSLAPGDIERAAVGADLLWLRRVGGSGVTEAARRSGLPVGVTDPEACSLDELIEAGAVAVERTSGDLDVADLARLDRIGLWCGPDVARQALAAGVACERLVVEGASSSDEVAGGTTLAGDGPAVWGAVIRAVLGGSVVVRTTDPRSVRRVVAVTDRLQRAHRARAEAAR